VRSDPVPRRGGETACFKFAIHTAGPNLEWKTERQHAETRLQSEGD
jgi:hypothetical protein